MQSKLSDPEWLQTGLDSQTSFGREWETRVVRMILHYLSSLSDTRIHAVRQLSRYRKQLAKA